METAALPPVGGRTSRSRVCVPAAWSRRRRRRRLRGIRSSPVRPRSVGALLRRRRRACGGRSPCVGDLYRSWSAATRHPPWRRPLRLLPCSTGILPRGLQRGWDIFCKDAAAAVGPTDGWRVDRARVSPDDGRRRALVQGRRSLGRGPGRWAIGDAFISSVRVSVYFDSSQSLVAMELRGCWGRRRAGDGVQRVAGEIALRRIRDAEGPRGLIVIFFVFEGPVCNTAVLCIIPECICICTGPCTVSLTLIQVCSNKKKSHHHPRLLVGGGATAHGILADPQPPPTHVKMRMGRVDPLGR